MDLKEIQQVVELMKRFDLTEFEIEEENLKLRLNRKQPGDAHLPMTSAAPFPGQAYHLPHPQMPAATSPAADYPSEPAAQAPEDSGTILIKCPMVGTFYRSPSPESPEFVAVGDEIQEDSVVCIVEAMKVMNEIQAEVAGVIAEILVENGSSVEYGQPLFKVRPRG